MWYYLHVKVPELNKTLIVKQIIQKIFAHVYGSNDIKDNLNLQLDHKDRYYISDEIKIIRYFYEGSEEEFLNKITELYDKYKIDRKGCNDDYNLFKLLGYLYSPFKLEFYRDDNIISFDVHKSGFMNYNTIELEFYHSSIITDVEEYECASLTIDIKSHKKGKTNIWTKELYYMLKNIDCRLVVNLGRISIYGNISTNVVDYLNNQDLSKLPSGVDITITVNALMSKTEYKMKYSNDKKKYEFLKK